MLFSMEPSRNDCALPQVRRWAGDIGHSNVPGPCVRRLPSPGFAPRKPPVVPRALVGSLLLALGGLAAGQEVDTPIRVNPSPLPEGAGLAASFPGDQGIAQHPAVRFADDFETGPLTPRWDDVRNPKDAVLQWGRPEAPAFLGRRCLRVEAHLDRDTGGGLTRWFESAPRVFVRFYTRFVSPCDAIHHFVTLRANRGLQGADRWSGFGGAGEKPAGDERFSTAVEPWTDWGRWPAPGRWHFYSYWYRMRRAPDGRYWGNTFEVPEAPLIPPDRWVCVEFMLQHNTPGQSDGEQAFWIDGRLMGHWTGIAWRRTGALRANALTLESYVTDRWARQPTNIIEFDNVVVATRYIGPAVPSPVESGSLRSK